MNKPIRATLSTIKILSVFLFLLTTNADGSIEKNVSDISDELMCPVCRGQTVAESNSALANDFREIIKKKLEVGESKQEIINYFTARYGNSVLASPPAKGISLFVWIAPLFVIIVGFLLASKFIYSNKTKTKSKKPIFEDKEKYFKKIEEEISKPDL